MNRKKEIKIGIFVVLTIIATIIVITYLRGNDFLQGNKTYYTSYQSVEGLSQASNVYINGFKSGRISKIKYNKSTKDYIFKIKIVNEYEIPQDSYFEIYSSDILGGKSLRLILGASLPLYKSGDTIPGLIQPDALAGIISNIGPITDQLTLLVNNLNTAINNINKILDEETQESVKGIVSSIEKSVESIEYIANNIKGSTPELTAVITNLNTLTQQLNSSAVKLDSSLENVTEITEELKEAELKETINNLKTLIVKIQDPNGSVGKLMSSDSLHNSLQNLSGDLSNLVKSIEANPKKYIRIKIF